MSGSEQSVINRVEAILGNAGFYSANIHGTAMGGQSGKPDIVSCVAGRFCAVECKADREKPTYNQWLHLVRVARSGGRAVVAYPDVEPSFVLTGCPNVVHVPQGEEQEAAMELFKSFKAASFTVELVDGDAR